MLFRFHISEPWSGEPLPSSSNSCLHLPGDAPVEVGARTGIPGAGGSGRRTGDRDRDHPGRGRMRSRTRSRAAGERGGEAAGAAAAVRDGDEAEVGTVGGSGRMGRRETVGRSGSEAVRMRAAAMPPLPPPLKMNVAEASDPGKTERTKKRRRRRRGRKKRTRRNLGPFQKESRRSIHRRISTNGRRSSESGSSSRTLLYSFRSSPPPGRESSSSVSRRSGILGSSHRLSTVGWTAVRWNRVH